jgi:hypothetical protein
MTSVAPAPSEKVAYTSTVKQQAVKSFGAGIQRTPTMLITATAEQQQSAQQRCAVPTELQSKASAAMSQPTVTLTIYIPTRLWGGRGRRPKYLLQRRPHVGSLNQRSCESVDCGTSRYREWGGTTNGTDTGEYPLPDNHNPSMMTTNFR